MSTREEIISEFYGKVNEDTRLTRSRQGQLEYFITTTFIRRFAFPGAKILEIGAGTGRYSVALAKEGFDVTAVELLEGNLSVLRKNGAGIPNLTSRQGDGSDLGFLGDRTFDLTLVFGPMYHLYDRAEAERAVDEAIRVTKDGGVIFFAFLSVYGIMFANYLYGRWSAGEEENFTEDYKVRHFKEQLFTGYDVAEFEAMFGKKPVTHLTTAGVDCILEEAEQIPDFSLPDPDFEKFKRWYLHFCEKRELLASSNHLLYICRKNEER
ncbi:MAG: class I SAM-dependent methyltransferase [Clostridia bacterium]|nr:class I SAM-dependent methyltransferase [Clostridia bacterium]